MTLNQVPQTFEEWLAQERPDSPRLSLDSERRAFAAGVASQQAENKNLEAWLIEASADVSPAIADAIDRALKGNLKGLQTQIADKEAEIERLRGALKELNNLALAFGPTRKQRDQMSVILSTVFVEVPQR